MKRNTRKTLTFVDAFAGCGGLSLGLLQAGLKGRFAIEQDAFAFATLKTNLLRPGVEHRFSWPRWLPKEAMSIDAFMDCYLPELRKLSGSIDVLAGGPPCQGFSAAGKRRIDDPRNSLFRSYVNLLEILEPRILLIENVRGFTADFREGSRVDNYAARLRKLLLENYDVYERLIDLSSFGIPQQRTRYFLIALHPDLGIEVDPFELLASNIPSFLRKLGLRAPVSSWSAISDLEVSRGGLQPSTECLGFNESQYTKPRTVYQKLMANGSDIPTDLRLARHRPDIVRRFEEIIELSHAEGRLNTTISTETRERFGLRKRALRVLDPDRPSPTITSMPDDLLHYSEPRTLTVRENARLQAFPDWFEFKGKYTTGGDRRRREVPRFTQVANAVPPLMARAIGEMLLDALVTGSSRQLIERQSPQTALRSFA